MNGILVCVLVYRGVLGRWWFGLIKCVWYTHTAFVKGCFCYSLPLMFVPTRIGMAFYWQKSIEIGSARTWKIGIYSKIFIYCISHPINKQKYMNVNPFIHTESNNHQQLIHNWIFIQISISHSLDSNGRLAQNSNSLFFVLAFMRREGRSWRWWLGMKWRWNYWNILPISTLFDFEGISKRKDTLWSTSNQH